MFVLQTIFVFVFDYKLILIKTKNTNSILFNNALFVKIEFFFAIYNFVTSKRDNYIVNFIFFIVNNRRKNRTNKIRTRKIRIFVVYNDDFVRNRLLKQQQLLR